MAALMKMVNAQLNIHSGLNNIHRNLSDHEHSGIRNTVMFSSSTVDNDETKVGTYDFDW